LDVAGSPENLAASLQRVTDQFELYLWEDMYFVDAVIFVDENVPWEVLEAFLAGAPAPHQVWRN
jgi:hypothetical protein